MSPYWIIFGKLVIWSEHVNPGSSSHEQAANFMFSLSQMALLGGTANLAIYFFDIGRINKTAYQMALLAIGVFVLLLNWAAMKKDNRLDIVVDKLKSEKGVTRTTKNVFVATYVMASFIYAFVIPLFLL